MPLQKPLIDDDRAYELYSELIDLINSNVIINDSQIDENKSILHRVRDFRIILEKLFSILSVNIKDLLYDNAARMKYIFKNYNIDQEVKKNAELLRSKLNKFHHPYSHIDVTITKEDYLLYLKTLCEIIHYFSNVNIPAELQKEYESVKHINIKAEPEKPKENIDFIKGCVVSFKKEQNQLIIKFQEDTNSDYLYIYIKDNNHLIYLNEIIWENSSANIFNIKKIPDKPFYNVSGDTIFVIEPDYLLSATQIKDCFFKELKGVKTNFIIYPSLYLLNKFRNSSRSINLIQGNIANYLLDSMMYNGSRDFDEVFNDSIKEHSLDIICISNKDNNNISDIVNDLKLNAKKHYEVISNFIKKLKAENKIVLKNKKNEYTLIHIEPNLISPLFGMYGRFDILLEYKTTENANDIVARDIIELKSTSKYPKDSPWFSDKVQLLCYDIILNSIYRDRIGSSSILYCSKQDNPIIPINKQADDARDLSRAIIKTRNHLLRYEYRLAIGDLTIEKIKKIINDEIGNYDLKIYKDFINEFFIVVDNLCKNNYENNSLNIITLKYLNHFIQFIAREQWFVKVGNIFQDDYGKMYGNSSLWKMDVEEKEKKHIILSGLEYDETKSNFDELIISFKRNLFSFSFYNLSTSLRVGDFCIIYPQYYKKDEDPTKKIFLRATITYMDNEFVSVKLRNFYPSIQYFKKYSSWFIEYDITNTLNDRLYKSLYEFIKSDNTKKELIFGLIKPEYSNLNPSNKIFHYDDIVNEAIHKSLSCKNYFLIQGPPGTAKTSIVLTNIVQNIYNTTDENIFIMAYTNRAVDEICDNLCKEKIDFIRLGRSEDKHDYCIDSLLDDLNINDLSIRINNCRIFVSTVHTAYESPVFELKKFHVSIIDEASQLLEPQIVGLLTRFDRFIMIGDEKQLPPIVVQDEMNVEDSDLKKIYLYSLSNSLFERLLLNAKNKKWNDTYILLQKHYRMHQKVAEFVNKNYYSNRLKEGTESQKANIKIFKTNSTNKIENILSRHRVIFIPSKKNTGKTNTHEAKIVVDVVKTIKDAYKNNFNEKTLGIITPFRAQINEIRNKLISSEIDKELINKITIDTVERFQGSEREIIIVSFSLNDKRKINLISSLTFDRNVDRKLNVTLTRAKEHLILVGCPQVLEKNEHYKKLLEYVKKENSYFNIQ